MLKFSDCITADEIASNNLIVIVNDNKSGECIHGIEKNICSECNAVKILCEHGNSKKSCLACKLCPHGNEIRNCPQCYKPNTCPHGIKNKYYCQDCGGSGFCAHGNFKEFLKFIYKDIITL